MSSLIPATEISLRDYQDATCQAVWQHILSSAESGVVALPTAGGKTICFAAIIKRLFQEWPRSRVCITAHREELLTQAEDKLLSVWPDAPVGIYSSALKRREKHAAILIAGINSIFKQAFKIDPFDVIIVDESHLVPKDSDTMYGKFLTESRLANPNVRIVGWTATPFRLGGGLIYGAGKTFDKLIHKVDIRGLIKDGWLSPLKSKEPPAQIDTRGVKTRNGDFAENQLQKKAMNVVESACEETARLGVDRKAWLVFACGVEHAENIKKALATHGVESEIVLGKTDSKQRKAIIQRFDEGRLQAVINVGCLTTGLDVTRIDLIACMRPTQSTTLWVQMLGRGMRLHPGKTDCLVLDFGGNTRRHGPIDSLDIKEPGVKATPYRTCPSCFTIIEGGLRVCPDCGFESESTERDYSPKHDASADVAPLLSTDSKGNPNEWTERPRNVTVSIHKKRGKPDSLRVDYFCGLQVFSEWICFEHSGLPRQKAARWWYLRTGEMHTPKTAQEAARNIWRVLDPENNHTNCETVDLSQSTRIFGTWLRIITEEVTIRRNGKYSEIVKHKLKTNPKKQQLPDWATKTAQQRQTESKNQDNTARMTDKCLTPQP